MPCGNFRRRFVDPILHGSKVHTIRCGKRNFKVGQTFFMQTGARFSPERFADRVITRVRPITISDVTVLVWKEDLSGFVVPPLDKFARADGFKDWADLRQFFLAMHGYQTGFDFKVFLIQGRLIQWAPAEWERPHKQKECR